MARGALSLALFALFGAGALAMSLVAAVLRRPSVCHAPIRASWRVLLWAFEATRLIRVVRDGLPRCSGCVIAANHPSLIDAVIVVALVPRTLFVAKHALKKNPFMSLIVRSASLPDDERLPEAARPYLEKGWNVLVFPEGTRSPAGGMRPFRRGAAQTAIRCRAPLVPVSIRQSRRILGKCQKPWDMGGSTVVYSIASGARIACAPAAGETIRSAAIRITGALSSEVRELLDRSREQMSICENAILVNSVPQ